MPWAFLLFISWSSEEQLARASKVLIGDALTAGSRLQDFYFYRRPTSTFFFFFLSRTSIFFFSFHIILHHDTPWAGFYRGRRKACGRRTGINQERATLGHTSTRG